MTPGQLLLAAFLAACLVAPAFSQTAPTASSPVVAKPRPVAVTSASGRTEVVGSKSVFKALRGK